MKKQLLFFIVINAFFINISYAHGDLHERIVKVTEAIKEYPDSAYLYVKRGKLFFQHEAYKKSIKDLKRSKLLGFSSQEQYLLLTKNNFRLGKYKKALAILEEALKTDSKNVKLLKLKAQLYFQLNQFEKAAINFEDVIKYSSKSFPENYIDASIAWEAIEDPQALEKSKAIIIQGIKDLGPLVSLYDRLIKVAINQKDYQYAISVQNIVIEISHRKESSYYRLSELHLLNGDKIKALESLSYANNHIKKLPERIKNTSFVISLKEDIKSQEILLLTNKEHYENKP